VAFCINGRLQAMLHQIVSRRYNNTLLQHQQQQQQQQNTPSV